MAEKKISWITAECYLDVDLPIIAELRKYYSIYWQVVLPYNCTIDNEAYVSSLIPNPGSNLSIEFVYQKYRMRDIRTLFQYVRVVKKAKSFNPDLYYLSNYQMPYGIITYKALLPIDKVVVPCHNVSTPKGASNAGFTEKYTKWWLKTFQNIQVFSKSQKKVLDTMVSGKNVLYAPLAIKDYGAPKINYDKNDSNEVRFLSFGIIQKYKRIDLLIEAGNLLVERGCKNFKITIAGNCKDWENYSKLVRYPKIFEFDIRRIPNEEVANLFAKNHYFVMPYQDIAQSGAITVAFRYNLPTLVSDIDPFKEFVNDGVTGLTFKSEDAIALVDKMQYIINNHEAIYQQLCLAQADYVEKELSLNSIVSRYIVFFDNI
ncbi:MAG: glycosyltransferase [Paludibacteraceae bacterium]|nr:glycosyltransferase [Paludibacteraceae bacterium]